MKKPASLEDRLNQLEKRVVKLENATHKKGGSLTKSTQMLDVERMLIDKIDQMSVPHLVIIALKLRPKQTRTELKQMLEDWGKVVGSWFKGGNLNNRLIKKNIVKRDGVNENNEEIFSLTKRGEVLAEELIDKIKSNA
jgi:hypothetical protein